MTIIGTLRKLLVIAVSNIIEQLAKKEKYLGNTNNCSLDQIIENVILKFKELCMAVAFKTP